MAKEPEHKQQKQYCNKFNKDFKNGQHLKKKKSYNTIVGKKIKVYKISLQEIWWREEGTVWHYKKNLGMSLPCVWQEVRDKRALVLAGGGLQYFSSFIRTDMFVMNFPSPYFGPCFPFPEITSIFSIPLQRPLAFSVAPTGSLWGV